MVLPRYIVAQVGARRSYAVPAILASAGMLETFYTDICGNVGLGRLFGLAAPFSSSLARLSGRCVPSSISRQTRTFPLRTAAHLWLERSTHPEPAAKFRSNIQWQIAVGRSAARQGFGNATHLFSMLGEFPTLITAAKERGLRIVSEVYTLLELERILAEERDQFPGWETDDQDLNSIRRELLAEDALLTKADFFICPSESVRDDLVLRRSVPISRTGIVPYGVHPRWIALNSHPQRGRILFAGTAGLGKGIHYLAMAAEQLAGRQLGLQFRVAGHVSSAIARQPICCHLNFLGRIPRDRMQEEFQKADLFVLPSLAEGSAEVTYEALATGVPVITTKSAGSVVRDGIEGRIVPERNPKALSSAIQELIEDRTLRNRMAAAARERAKDFTWEHYAERLLPLLR